jgi:hypothetical protein
MGRAEAGSIAAVRVRLRLVFLVATLCIAGSSVIARAETPPLPIPSIAIPPPPSYAGAPAAAHKIPKIGPIPRNPFMAANGRSLIHDDGWQTDTYRWGGPLGRSPQRMSSLLNRDCGSITFDTQGRVVSICIGLSGPQLYMFDPSNLATLATFSLPGRQDVPSNIFQDFTGGGYFYLDNHDRVVTATTTKHIYVIAESGMTPASRNEGRPDAERATSPSGSPGFTLVRDYDLSGVLSSSEKITSALPDSHGLLWVVTKLDGVVVTLNLKTGRINARRLGNGTNGEIENSFATDQRGGVYIATNRKLYRFKAGRGGRPKIVWQVRYPNSFESKRGQVDDGTGTTPTVMPGGYVNITDNADPMHLVVYRTAAKATRLVRRHRRLRRVRAKRLVCKVPIFSRGSSADENSVIAVGRSMIAENNYGYTGPTDTENGKRTATGFVRVDINRNGRGCHVVWKNTTEDAPTVVSKLSIANGLIYTYTKDPGSSDPWYWTAIDFPTGRAVFKVLAGTGIGYNNNYSGIAISPSGTAYLGALGGIIALRDGG